MSLQDAIKPTANMVEGNANTAADQIQIQDGNGYKTYYLSNGFNGKASTPATKGKWVSTTAKTTPTADTIRTGTGFWFITKEIPTEPFDIQVAGSVLMSSDDSVVLNQNYSIIANPYPCDIPLNGGVIVINGTEGNANTAADQIQIQDGNGYKTYYLSNGFNGKASTPATKGKWVATTAKTVATEDPIPAGAGVWFIRKSSENEASLKFISPIKDAK